MRISLALVGAAPAVTLLNRLKRDVPKCDLQAELNKPCNPLDEICTSCEEICQIGSCSTGDVWHDIADNVENTAEAAGSGVVDVAEGVTPKGVHDAVKLLQKSPTYDTECLAECQKSVSSCKEIYDDPSQTLDDEMKCHYLEHQRMCSSVQRIIMIIQSGNVKAQVQNGIAPEFAQLDQDHDGKICKDDINALGTCLDGGSAPSLNMGLAFGNLEALGGCITEEEFYADARCFNFKCGPDSGSGLPCGADFGERLLDDGSIAMDERLWDERVDPEEIVADSQHLPDAPEAKKALSEDDLDESHHDYDHQGNYVGDHTDTTNEEEADALDEKEDFFDGNESTPEDDGFVSDATDGGKGVQEVAERAAMTPHFTPEAAPKGKGKGKSAAGNFLQLRDEPAGDGSDDSGADENDGEDLGSDGSDDGSHEDVSHEDDEHHDDDHAEEDHADGDEHEHADYEHPDYDDDDDSWDFFDDEEHLDDPDAFHPEMCPGKDGHIKHEGYDYSQQLFRAKIQRLSVALAHRKMSVSDEHVRKHVQKMIADFKKKTETAKKN